MLAELFTVLHWGGFDSNSPASRHNKHRDNKKTTCAKDGCTERTTRTWCQEHRGHDTDYAGYGGCTSD